MGVAEDARIRRSLLGLTKAHTGFPEVLSVVSEGSLMRIGLRITADLCWFRGHFPEKAVLPGIVQLHWAALVGRKLYGVEGSPSEIKRLKFKKMVEPPVDLELTVSHPGEREVRFSFASLGEQNSEGTIVFPERQ